MDFGGWFQSSQIAANFLSEFFLDVFGSLS